jgi:amino acid adenylation domain-containing protein
MRLPSISVVRGAALAALALRRFPVDATTATLRCDRCGSSASAPVDESSTSIALLDLAAGLDHDCTPVDLVAYRGDDDSGALRWTGSGGPSGRVAEPDDDQRWSAARGMELLGSTAEAMAADPTTPIFGLRLNFLHDIASIRPLPPRREHTVHAAFYAQALRTPDAAAVVTDFGITTYRTVLEQASRVAGALAAAAAGPIAVDVQPGPTEVAVLLGVLAAGRPYLAFDRKSPADRLRRMADLAQPALLVTDLHAAPEARSLGVPVLPTSELLADPAGADEIDWTVGGATTPAYIMFTSGTSGAPKGVVAAHESVLRLVDSDIMAAPDKRGRFLRAAPLAFDASTFELWVPLLHGGAVVSLRHPVTDVESLASGFRRHAVDVAWLTSGLFHQICDIDPSTGGSLRWLFTGGDVTRPDAVRLALDGGTPRVVNGYGPTENTVFTTTWLMTDPDVVTARRRCPIGRPLGGDLLRVCDKAGHPVPQGLAGELVVAGTGVALRYLTDDAAARRRLGVLEHDGQRLRSYRTGDVVAQLQDGSFDFLGRVDDQIKWRGFRVELAEIEAAAVRVPGVRNAAACLHSAEPDGEQTLLAAVVTDPGQPVDVEQIQHELRKRLPDYMLPDRVVCVDRLPLTGSGKVDRRALSELVRAIGTGAGSTDPVRAAVELVLGHGEFTDDDNLLECGLHSLRALRLLRELRQVAGGLSLLQVLSNTSVLQLRTVVAESMP